MAKWLTPDQEEHRRCGQGIIPTTWTTLCPEQLWTLLIHHKTNAAEGIWSKIFWHNHICYHTRARRSRGEAWTKEPGTGKIRKGREKKTTRRGCFEKPNRLLPSIFRGWNFSLAVRRNSNRRSSCPQPARFEKTSTAHTLPAPPPTPHPSHLSQTGNQWETHTQTQHGCERQQDELLWQVGPPNKSVTWLDDHVHGCVCGPSLVLCPHSLKTVMISQVFPSRAARLKTPRGTSLILPCKWNKNKWWCVDLSYCAITRTSDNQKLTKDPKRNCRTEIQPSIKLFTVISFYYFGWMVVKRPEVVPE